MVNSGQAVFKSGMRYPMHLAEAVASLQRPSIGQNCSSTVGPQIGCGKRFRGAFIAFQAFDCNLLSF